VSRKKNHLALVSNAHVGRPRLEDFERRTRRIGVPVNKEEDEIISDKSKLTHMKKGVFLRHLGLSKRIQRPVPAINYRAYRQLGRLAADFSYALILIEEGVSIGVDPKLVAQILEEIRRTQNQLMKGE
jgi:hypothetical protein